MTDILISSISSLFFTVDFIFSLMIRFKILSILMSCNLSLLG